MHVVQHWQRQMRELRGTIYENGEVSLQPRPYTRETFDNMHGGGEQGILVVNYPVGEPEVALILAPSHRKEG